VRGRSGEGGVSLAFLFSVRRKTANFKLKMEKRVEKRGGACGNACEGGFGEV